MRPFSFKVASLALLTLAVRAEDLLLVPVRPEVIKPNPAVTVRFSQTRIGDPFVISLTSPGAAGEVEFGVSPIPPDSSLTTSILQFGKGFYIDVRQRWTAGSAGVSIDGTSVGLCYTTLQRQCPLDYLPLRFEGSERLAYLDVNINVFGISPASVDVRLLWNIIPGTGPGNDDLSIDHVEVVQAIQTRDNKVTLVAGRKARVRVFLRAETKGDGAREILLVNGSSLPGTPDQRYPAKAPLGPPDTRLPAANAKPETHSLDFDLPENVLRDRKWKFTLKTRVWITDKENREVSESDLSNNTLDLPLEFNNDPARTLQVGVLPVCVAYSPNDVKCPQPIDAAAQRRINQWLPSTAYFPLVPHGRLTVSPELLEPANIGLTIALLLRELLEYRVAVINQAALMGEFRTSIVLPDHISFQVHGSPRTDKGVDELAPGGLGGIWLFRDDGKDPDSVARQVMHGLGHQFGLPHYTGPRPFDGFLNPTPWDDFAKTVPLEPAWDAPLLSKTIMDTSPCNDDGCKAWIGPDEWNTLAAKLRAPAAPGAKAAPRESRLSAESGIEYLVVSGSVSQDGSTGKLEAGLRGVASLEMPASDPAGDTCLRVTGTSTTEFCFTPFFLDGSTTGHFAAAAPVPPGATTVTLVRNGRDVTTLPAAGARPSVQVLSPAGGERWQGRQKIRWMADRDGLSFRVQYSPNNGDSWLPLSPALTANEYEFDTAEIVGGPAVKFRVMAVSGIDSVSADSPAIEIVQRKGLTFSAVSVRFRNLQAGDEETREVVVTNTGEGVLLLPVTPPSNPVFGLLTEPAVMLSPGASATLGIRFAPTEPGAYDDVLRVGTSQIALFGNGVASAAPSIEVPSAGSGIAFGPVSLGASREVTLDIGNRGDAPLSIASVERTNERFTVFGAPAKVEPGRTAQATLRFTPSVLGQQEGTVTIKSDDPAQPLITVPLSGRGVPAGTGSATSTPIAMIEGWPNGRTSDNLPPNAIDGDTATFTWTTEAFNRISPSYLGVGFAPSRVNRIRLFKDNDSGGAGLVAKNLTVEYTASAASAPLPARIWQPVTGLVNGSDGAELLDAAAVNRNGTVDGDNQAGGWASLTFDPVDATGIRIGFANAGPVEINHYRVYEIEVHRPVSSGSGGGTAPTMAVLPASLAFGNTTAGVPKSLSVQVSNAGNATLNVGASVSGSGFSLTTPSAFSISVGGAPVNVTVQFQPASATAAAGTLTLTSNDPAQPSLAIPLTGTGTSASGGGTGATGPNLLQNGGADATTVTGCQATASIPGWTTDGKVTVCSYTTGSGFPTAADPGPPNRGQNFFAGGESAASSISQTVSLASLASQIDGGSVPYALSGWLGGYAGDGDSARVTLTFLNQNGSATGSAAIGPVTPTDRGGRTGLFLRAANGNVPAGTRSAQVVVEFTRTAGATNDGYADDLSLLVGTGGGGGVGGTANLQFFLNGIDSNGRVNFLSVPVRTPSTVTLEVRNTGTAAAVVNSITSSNPVFTANPQSFTVDAGRSGTLNVVFMPAQERAEQGVLTLNLAGGATSTLNLSGTGVAATGGGSGATGTNLLQNGGADAAPVTGCQALPSIPGWTTDGKVVVCSYTTGGGYPTAADPGPPNRGPNFFAGGESATSSISQTVSLASLAAQIDAGSTPYTLSGYLGGYAGDGDTARATLTFLNQNGSNLGTAAIGPVTPTDRGGRTGLFLRTANGNVPAGTRSARVVVEFTRTAGSSNDGYADDLSLIVGSGGGGGGTGGGTPSLQFYLNGIDSNGRVNFLSVPVRTPSTVTLEVRNTGTAAAVVSSITSSNPVFTANPQSFTVEAGRSGTLNVVFTPAQERAEQGVLTLNLAGGATATLNLSGTGVAATGGGSGATGTNLLQNGGADAATVSGCQIPASIPGWTTDGKVAVCSYTTGSGYPTAADPGPPNRGQNFFAGGESATSTISQTVSLAALATQIDAGSTPYTLSGYLGGYAGDGDTARVTLTFLNQNGSNLGTAAIGPVTATDRNGRTGLFLRSANGNVPGGARSARVVVEFTRNAGSSNDGYADDISLLVGTGGGAQQPTITFEPSSLSFTAAEAGQTKIVRATAITDRAIDLLDVVSSNPSFVVSLSQISVAGPYALNIPVRFVPTGAGTHQGIIRLLTDPAVANAQFTVTGEGSQPSGGGGGSGTGTARVTITIVGAWPNGRVSNNTPSSAEDGSLLTYTWTTESGNNVNPAYLGVGFAGLTSVSRIRLFKDNDSGGAGPIAKNLVIEYTSSPASVPLASRVWLPVSGISNGFQGIEAMAASAVLNGVVLGDNHNSLVQGWASLSFDPVNATAVRVGFSNATPLSVNHYRVYELEVYGPPGGSVGGGQPSISISPRTLNFESVPLDRPKDLQLQVSNTGNAALSVTSVSATNARFTMESSLTSLISIQPGQTVPVTIRFSPNALGAQSGTLRFVSNDPVNGTVTVDVSGTGVAATGGGGTGVPATGPNLLQNGDAEAGPAVPGCGAAASIPGWNTDGRVAVCSYTLGGGYPVATDPGPPNRGRNFFGGGSATQSVMNQVVSLSSVAGQIDAGTAPFTLSGYLGGFGDQGDSVRVSVTFLNASGTVLGTASTIGPVTNGDRQNRTALLLRSLNGTVPAGARSARVTTEFNKSGGDSNDGYADDLSLQVGR